MSNGRIEECHKKIPLRDKANGDRLHTCHVMEDLVGYSIGERFLEVDLSLGDHLKK
jgi:hypothetical protein